jgi:four helix bundle protein
MKRFEDMEVWQATRDLAQRIFVLINREPFSKDYKLRDQINASSGSIMDNIAEGFERDGNREFRQFLSIAKGSAGEVRSQLYRAFDRGYLTKSEFDELQLCVLSISKQLSGLMHYLNSSDIKGRKFANEPEEPYNTEPET